jgi:hypothetical protein
VGIARPGGGHKKTTCKKLARILYGLMPTESGFIKGKNPADDGRKGIGCNLLNPSEVKPKCFLRIFEKRT